MRAFAVRALETVEPRPRRDRALAAAACIALGVLISTGCVDPTIQGADLHPVGELLSAERPLAALPLGSGRVLVDTSEGLFVLERGSATPTRVGESGELGELRAFAAVDGSTLVAGSEGVALVSREGMFAAPLATVLGETERVVSLCSVPRRGHPADLWVSTDVGTYLYRDLALRPVTIEGRDLSSARLASGGDGRAWIATADALIAIDARAEEEVEATAITGLGAINGLASDDQGRAWLSSDTGLVAIATNLELTRLSLGASATGVRASGVGPDVWIETEGGLFHGERNTLRRVIGLGDATLAGAGADGQLLVTSARGVELFRSRRDVALEGLSSERVVETTTVEVIAETPERASFSASIDRVSIEMSGSSLTLDPNMLDLGQHTLEVRVSWDDGTLQVLRRVEFEVASSVTWSDHIRPLYDAQCADCHGAAGPSPTRLDSMESWEMRIDRILENVREGRMPLGRPALSPASVDLIEIWSRSGFAE